MNSKTPTSPQSWVRLRQTSDGDLFLVGRVGPLLCPYHTSLNRLCGSACALFEYVNCKLGNEETRVVVQHCVGRRIWLPEQEV